MNPIRFGVDLKHTVPFYCIGSRVIYVKEFCIIYRNIASDIKLEKSALYLTIVQPNVNVILYRLIIT